MRIEFMILCLLLSAMAMQTASIGVSAYVPGRRMVLEDISPRTVDPAPSPIHPEGCCGDPCCCCRSG